MLDAFKNLKTKTTQAKNSIQSIEDEVLRLEAKLKESIGTLKDLTQP